jgi:hypothetical protein
MAYTTHLTVRSKVHNMRYYAQMQLDMSKHATAREIATVHARLKPQKGVMCIGSRIPTMSC